MKKYNPDSLGVDFPQNKDAAGRVHQRKYWFISGQVSRVMTKKLAIVPGEPQIGNFFSSLMGQWIDTLRCEIT